jgi:hypothetical protein
MKKTFKLLGIIALALVIGFSMVACGGGDGDDDGKEGKDTKSGGAYASELQGTWVGDATNGTLIITADKVDGGKDSTTNSYDVETQILYGEVFSKNYGGVKGDSGKIYYNFAGTTTICYTYTIAGSTLTLKDEDGVVAFVGTKS